MNKHIEMVFAAITYIERNLADSADVQDVCAQIKMSSWQFQRLFRALVGDSIGSYLRGRRLTKARDLCCLENVGLADASLATINYIYGIWLPNSEYQRAPGVDFEVFDQRYSLSNPQSVSSYYLSIENLKAE